MIGDAAQQEQSQSETTVGASAVAAQPAASAPAPEASTASDGQHAVSPLARRIAAENNVDLAQVKGNSPHGRVTREDVINYIGQASTAAPDTVTPVNQANNIAPAAPAQPAPAPAPERRNPGQRHDSQALLRYRHRGGRGRRTGRARFA